MRFFQLEVRDAIAQQAADAIAFFEYGHGVARTRQLLRAGKPGGTGADHGNLFAGFPVGRLRRHPALRPAFVDAGVFYRLDADGVVVDVQGTGGFAGRRAAASRDPGNIVWSMTTL